MQLSDLSVRRPVFAAVLAILLTIIGVVGFLSLSVREYPDTDPPVVSVDTSYTGAAASVIETRVTQLIEDEQPSPQGNAEDRMPLTVGIPLHREDHHPTGMEAEAKKQAVLRKRKLLAIPAPSEEM